MSKTTGDVGNDAGGLAGESGDNHQQQPLSKVKPVYLLAAAGVAVLIAVVILIIALTRT